MNGKRFYVVQDDEQTGPFPIGQLNQVNYANRSTQLWTEGLNDWVRVTGYEDALIKLNISRAPSAPTANSSPVIEPLYSGQIADAGLSADSYRYADAGKRFGAFMINYILGFIVSGMVFKTSSHYYEGIVLNLTIAALCYIPFSGNIGHRILGVKVVDAATGEEFKNPAKAIVRELAKSLSTYLIVPVIWFLWDKKKQNLYDKIFNTIVIDR